jgi:hypothetical protein
MSLFEGWFKRSVTEGIAKRVEELFRGKATHGGVLIVVGFVILYFALIATILRGIFPKPEKSPSDALALQVAGLDQLKENLWQIQKYIDDQSAKMRQVRKRLHGWPANVSKWKNL